MAGHGYTSDRLSLNCVDSQSVSRNYEFAYGGNHQDSLNGKNLQANEDYSMGTKNGFTRRPATRLARGCRTPAHLARVGTLECQLFQVVLLPLSLAMRYP